MRWWPRSWTARFRRRAEPVARSADEAVRMALQAVLDQELDDAEALLSRVVREDSDRIDVYLALASLYRRQGEIGRAIRIHQNLLLRNDLDASDRRNALRGLAQDFQRGGFLRRALAAWEEVLEGEPKSQEALAALARIYADLREHERALELERRLGRERGEDSKAREAQLLVEMARAAETEGRSDDARKSLRKALKRDPDSVGAWLALGALEAERGRARKALVAWKKVPELDRRTAATVYPKIEASYAALGRAREFETWLRSLLEERPGDGAARLALARSLAARGDGAEALTELDALLERDGEDLAAHVERGRVLLGEGREAEAVKAFSEVLELVERRGLLAAREGLE